MAVALNDRRRPIDVNAAVVALLVSVVWGANPVAIKIGLGDAPPLRVAWMRFEVGVAVIVLWAWATGPLRGLRIERREIRVANLWLLGHHRPGALAMAPFFLTQPIFGVVIANLVTGDALTAELLVASLAVGIGLTTR